MIKYGLLRYKIELENHFVVDQDWIDEIHQTWVGQVEQEWVGNSVSDFPDFYYSREKTVVSEISGKTWKVQKSKKNIENSMFKSYNSTK